jgi:hypothetical protein
MRTCEYTLLDGHYCDAPCEGNTPYCGTHNRLIRKEASNQLKATEKRAQQIELSKLKAMKSRPTPNKVSDHQKEALKIYKVLRTNFLKINSTCKARISSTCSGKATDVHHKKGRSFLNDVTTFLAVCRDCHIFIESHPLEAKEKGLSESRLATTEPHKI